MYPDAPYIRRNGEVDAWDNADFREAVAATGKSQIILAGITTDVCMSSASAAHRRYMFLSYSPEVTNNRHGIPRSVPARSRLHGLREH